MPDLGPHAAFIIGAYAVAFVALGVLTLVTVANDRKQRNMLLELERKGIRRRSAAKTPTPTVRKTKARAAKAKLAKTTSKRKPARTRKTRT